MAILIIVYTFFTLLTMVVMVLLGHVGIGFFGLVILFGKALIIARLYTINGFFK
jgi:hypothetical protein